MFTVVFLGLSIIKMEKKIELLREKKKVIAKMIELLVIRNEEELQDGMKSVWKDARIIN